MTACIDERAEHSINETIPELFIDLPRSFNLLQLTDALLHQQNASLFFQDTPSRAQAFERVDVPVY